MTEVLRERGASGYFKKLVVLVREHVTSAMIGGLVLMLTGFSPEDWFVEAMHAIHLPKAWSLGIDPRILLVTLGVAIIVGDQLLRRRTASQAELAGAGPGIAASPQAVAATQQSASTPALALPETPSIAVLQFSNISGDAAQEYFSDGMVEDIISGLSRVKWLFVIARNSSFTYKGKAVDVKQVGRELGVRYVLEGGLRKSADRLRITAQLIDAATGAHVWAERYDRKADDVFALQDEITLSIVGAVEPSLRRAEVERVKRKRPDSLDAYDLVLQAQPDVYSGMPERAERALPPLQRALALDPTYALAHAFSAMCYHVRFLRSGFHEEDRAASIRRAQTALVYGSDDALALTFAGFSIGMDATIVPVLSPRSKPRLPSARHRPSLIFLAAPSLVGRERLIARSSGANERCD